MSTITGGSPHKEPVMRSSGDFFVVCMSKLLNKKWMTGKLYPLTLTWRHPNEYENNQRRRSDSYCMLPAATVMISTMDAYWPLNTMVATLQAIFWNAISWKKKSILIQISPKIIPRGPDDNVALLVQVMAWCYTGDKPWPESLLTHTRRRVNPCDAIYGNIDLGQHWSS